MPRAKKTLPATSEISRPRPRRRKKDYLDMRESAEVDIPLSTASVLLAQCPDERQFIFELLQKIYFSGFASGAVASRKKFTEWKPPRNFDKNFVKDMMDIVDQFSMEMAVIHRPPFSGSLN